MSLTTEELNRIEALETELIEIRRLMNGAASKNMLNRLLTLANQQVSSALEEVTTLETKVDQMIALLQKLQ